MARPAASASCHQLKIELEDRSAAAAAAMAAGAAGSCAAVRPALRRALLPCLPPARAGVPVPPAAAAPPAPFGADGCASDSCAPDGARAAEPVAPAAALCGFATPRI